MKIKHLESDNILEIFTVKTGGEERMVCPVCSKDRKKSRIKCFSWNHDKQTGRCSHCNATFVQQEQKDFAYISREKREYKTPVWNNNTELSENLVKWFEGRKISQFVLRQMKISEGEEWMPQVGAKRNTVQFNYFRNGELVNVKYRDGAKNFKLASGAELIFYNYDNCIGKEQIVIVEGEIDALSLIQAGISNVLSVPNGAGLGHVNLEYLDNCLELFENAKEIIIATDNDSPGTNLKNQLAFRLGVERCYKVDFGKYKDSNDVLINEGEDFLKSLIIDKKESFPIEGIYSSRDFSKELYLLYENGLQPGVGIGVNEFDKHLTFEPGRLYTWTGIPGCGKSEFLDFVIERLNILHGWKAVYFSPENHPLQLHASKLIEKITGFKFSNRTMPPDIYHSACDYINDNFYFINPENDFSLDTILEKVRISIFKYGVKNVIIDPYNKIEHQFTGSETQYISQFLDKLTNFAKRNNIVIHLVAHPRKMNKDATGKFEIPSLYDINGSANFYNKTDFGITIYRQQNSTISQVYIQKVKFKHLGELGKVEFEWNKENGRYAYFDGLDVYTIKHDFTNHLDKFKEPFIVKEIQFTEAIDDFNNSREVPF